jgi:hypothetical protein
VVVLRATKRVLQRLPSFGSNSGASDTALGDWYVNRFVVDRKPLLILVSSKSLLAILIPARDVRSLPARLSNIVAERLVRLGVSATLVRREIEVMEPVHLAPTLDRSVLGVMVDASRAVPFYLPEGGWGEVDLHVAEVKLAHTPYYAGRRREEVVFPGLAATELLSARWSS